MGTNYYLHIGKRVAERDGLNRFIWAVERHQGHLNHWGVTQVIDENGTEMTWAEFYDKIAADISDERMVGGNFS